MNSLDETIAERKDYLATIERDIEAVTLEGSNMLLTMRGEVEILEKEKAHLMRTNFGLQQIIRENQLIVDSMG